MWFWLMVLFQVPHSHGCWLKALTLKGDHSSSPHGPPHRVAECPHNLIAGSLRISDPRARMRREQERPGLQVTHHHLYSSLLQKQVLQSHPHSRGGDVHAQHICSGKSGRGISDPTAPFLGSPQQGRILSDLLERSMKTREGLKFLQL